MTRQDGRAFDELRPIKITPDFVKFAEGSCLIQCGNTMVLCCASVEDRVPPHVPEGTGWVTAEYSMLPRANRERSKRDIAKLKLSPRSAEIQRLVGRSSGPPWTWRSWGSIPSPSTATCSRATAEPAPHPSPAALWRWPWPAGSWWRRACWPPIPSGISSPGCLRESSGETLMLDLQYSEDSRAQVDLNCVMNELGEIIELQGTGEGRAFTPQEQQELVRLCAKGNRELLKLQREILKR